MTNKQTRRAILAGAACLPVLAIPALAADPALSFEEVKRLYAELDPETKKFFRALTSQDAPAEITDIDPILAAIERHKVAFHASQAAGRVKFHTIDAEWHPDYDTVECKAVNEAATASDDAATDAADALTTIRPTSIAGMLALMHYVEMFNAGAFALDIDPDNWRSRPMHWPADVDDDEIDLFGYSVLANVRDALEALAVQS
jgi:hypothetical protein